MLHTVRLRDVLGDQVYESLARECEKVNYHRQGDLRMRPNSSRPEQN